MEKDLIDKYGPMVGGPDLVKVLGYRSNASFRRAEKLGQIDIRIFPLRGRKGKFAMTKDIADWLRKLSSAQ
jgi:hypothetical protein